MFLANGTILSHSIPLPILLQIAWECTRFRSLLRGGLEVFIEHLESRRYVVRTERQLGGGSWGEAVGGSGGAGGVVSGQPKGRTNRCSPVRTTPRRAGSRPCRQ